MTSIFSSQLLASIRTGLEPDALEERDQPLSHALAQPLHTLYGGAQLFKEGSVAKLGRLARDHFIENAPDAGRLMLMLDAEDMPKALWQQVYDRVIARLNQCPIADIRIDFEDGYGYRSQEEEDADAKKAAVALAAEKSANALPRSCGIRIKPFTAVAYSRSVRTLDLFMSHLMQASQATLPDGFVVTLPKVTNEAQVRGLASLLAIIERRFGLVDGCLKLEIMVESPEAICDHNGVSPLRRLVAAAEGRCRGVHFGTYDYSAACDITAEHQYMGHPVCVHALNVMKASLYQAQVWLSDGATNILPLPVFKALPGQDLSVEQATANQQAVKTAWLATYQAVQHSLTLGYFQGWDLHPFQIGPRLVALYLFFLRDLSAATLRLDNFIRKAAQATSVGGVFDDAASGQGLLNFFVRAVDSGAVSEREIRSMGLSLADLRSRSFTDIVKVRRI